MRQPETFVAGRFAVPHGQGGAFAMRVRILLTVIGLLLLTSGASAQPQRIVSLDYCADQYVLGLADRSQIAALSPDARADFSSHADIAEGLPQARPLAEEIIAHRPDMVVRSWGGDPRILALFERLDIPVHQIGHIADFDDIRRETRGAASAFGQPERGDAVLATMDGALASVSAASATSALYVTPGGVTAGQGTFVDALLSAAGLRNAAASQTGWVSLPLEAVATQTPAIFVTGFANSATDRVDRWSASRHPVMRRALSARPVLALDTGVIACTTWLAGAEAARLHAFALRQQPLSGTGAQP
ncbi:ABC transporter substrate-binding protein [Glycocaulis abyssi]|uniref:ABC transporter substrate-binding protein n=1 Tax=Glycocaulis abyssi TaxID=1433403 RepID=A0ABV9NCM7_9PROT